MSLIMILPVEEFSNLMGWKGGASKNDKNHCIFLIPQMSNPV